MLELGVKILIAYLLGTLLGSLILGRLRGVDIRNMGSGNAGATNALHPRQGVRSGGVDSRHRQGRGRGFMGPGSEPPGCNTGPGSVASVAGSGLRACRHPGARLS